MIRRTKLLALLAALLLVPTTTAHAQSREDILRDCADDDILQGDYPASKMRDALNNQPAELEEYSKCRDVLSRAIAAKTTVSSPSDSSSDGNAGGTTTRGGSGGGTPTDPGAAATPQRTGKDPGVVTGPSTPQDWKAIDGAIERGSDTVAINGRPISPAATVGRNAIPVSLVVVLALLAMAAVAVTVPAVRRRVPTRSSPARGITRSG